MFKELNTIVQIRKIILRHERLETPGNRFVPDTRMFARSRRANDCSVLGNAFQTAHKEY